MVLEPVKHEVLVEGSGEIVLCIHYYSHSSNSAASPVALSQGVEQQGSSKPSASKSPIYGQAPRQDRGKKIVSGKPLSKLLG